MFIDEAKIRIKAGDGGNGCMAFRREKFVPRGGPSGGDGGHGGDILMSSSLSHNTLVHFRFNPEHKSGRGEHGMGSNCSGEAGAPVTLNVPVGTLLYDDDTGELIHDFARPDQTIVIARGGRGGRGNQHFATSTHQAPREHELGRPGEERHYRLELRLLADAGLVGYPNVGKSTLISRLSAAKPKIANYAFTTLEPNLGVVQVGDFPHTQSFTIADLPGLIEGAHLGAGLGIQFLRHIERTSVIVHLVDVSDFGYAPEPTPSPTTIPTPHVSSRPEAQSAAAERPASPPATNPGAPGLASETWDRATHNAPSAKRTKKLPSPPAPPSSNAVILNEAPTHVILSGGAAGVEGPASANASAAGTSPTTDLPADPTRDPGVPGGRSSLAGIEDPVQAFKTITAELASFDPALAAKPTILVAAKSDVANPEKLKKLRTYAKRRKLPFFEISAITGQGIDQLKYAIADAVQTHRVITLDPDPELSPKKPKPNYPPPAPNARGRAIS